MSIFQTPLQVVASAFVVRNIIQYLKKKNVKFNNIEIMIVSYVLNFLFTFAYGIGLSLYYHQPLSWPIVESFAGMILSALYHDFNTQNPITMIFQNPSSAVPVAGQTSPAGVPATPPTDQGVG